MSNPHTLSYALADVFAERPLEGNQLAIFADGRGLPDARMQAIAREMNLSETTFILPRDEAVEAERGVRVRIFTTEEELPFAGHPTLGTASWLHSNHPSLRGRDELRLELTVGTIPVRFRAPQAGELGTFATMEQPDPIFGEVHDPVAVARACGLSPEDLDPAYPVETVSTGVPFVIVPLRSMAVSGRLSIPSGPSRAYLGEARAHFFYTLTRTPPESAARWHARMQFYNGEDPATGSAAGCAAAWLVRHGLAQSGEQTVLEQGLEIGRPSRIEVRATLADGRVTGVFVGGRTIPVASGLFFLP